MVISQKRLTCYLNQKKRDSDLNGGLKILTLVLCCVPFVLEIRDFPSFSVRNVNQNAPWSWSSHPESWEILTKLELKIQNGDLVTETVKQKL